MAVALRSAATLTLASALLLTLLAPGCSQQGEGERCQKAKTGDADCDSGLKCVPATDLLDGTSDRCCPTDGSYNDSRCAPSTGRTSGGSSGSSNSSSGGEGGEPGAALGGGGGAGANEAAAGSPESSGGQLGLSGAPGGEAGNTSTAGAGEGGGSVGGEGGSD